MNCVVTGGAGFIGSHLVDQLIARGDQVDVVDDLTSGTPANLRGATANGARLHEFDVRDEDRLQRLFAAVNPEVVFHMAAQIDVRRSVEHPGHDACVNVLGMIAVLDAARTCGVRRVVNTSTGGGLYGEAAVLPTPEEHPIRPLAPYGQSKHAAECYCELYTRLHGLSTISLRYGNVYGPRQDARGEAGVVAIFCGCLESGQAPTVFGDGRQTRDWVEVGDVVRANLLAAEVSTAGAVNIAWGRETSVLELIDALSAVGDRRLAPPVFAAERHGEVRRSALAVDRAYEELNWKPSVELPAGLRGMLAEAG